MFMFVTNTRTHDTAQTISDKYVDAVGSVESIANSTKNVSFNKKYKNFDYKREVIDCNLYIYTILYLC